MTAIETAPSPDSPPIPILYLVDTFVSPIGGSERQLLTLLERLDRTRFMPYVAFLDDHPKLDGLHIPCEFTTLGYQSLAGLDFFRAGFRCRTLCRDKGIQIVHTYFPDASRFGAVWARAVGVPVVVGSRRNLGYMYGSVDMAFLRLFGRFTTHFIANSKAAAERAARVEHLDPARFSVIMNGIEPSRFVASSSDPRRSTRERWGIPDSALLVGSVANLRPIKNIPFLVEAAARLVPRYPELHFVVLGEGTDRPKLEARVRELGLTDRFLLPGFSARVHEDVQAFDLGVLSSDSESSPNSVFEYLAAGIPSIAAAVGGIPEILVSEDIGFLYAPGDTAQFDAVMSRLIEDAALRSNVSRSARAHAIERFSVDRMVREHEALYSSLLARAGVETLGKSKNLV